MHVTNLRHALLGLLAALALTACGGGGGSSSSDPPTPTNRAPTANAGSDMAAMVASGVAADGSASSDPDGDAITYAWTLASAPAGSTAALSNATTAKPALTPDKDGVYTLSLTVSDGKLASSAATVKITAAPLAVEIVADHAEPLADVVKLSLTGKVTAPVTWYADLNLIGPAADGSTALSWDTATVTNGAHQLVARVQTSATTTQEIKRTVQVTNPTVTLNYLSVPAAGSISVYVSAKSIYSVTRVSATLDGADAGALTAPNACYRLCGPAGFDYYLFVIDTARTGSGNHTLLVTGVDAAGSMRQLSIPIAINNGPVVSLPDLPDGVTAFGTLQVKGTASSDKPGTVTVTAKLADTPITLQSVGTNFTGSLDISTVPAGSYTLTVTATDASGLATTVTRMVVVASSAAQVYTPAFTLPAGARMVAADAGHVVYSAGESVGPIVVHDLASGTEVTLADVGISTTSRVVDGGRVYEYGTGTDCTKNQFCVYQWGADGSARNLSLSNPFAGSSWQTSPVARDGYVLWANGGAGKGGSGSGSLTLYNAASGTYANVAMPAGVFAVGTYNFVVLGGVVDIVYSANTGYAPNGDPTTIDIYRWRSDTQASVKLTDGTAWNTSPQTDGTTVAWRQAPNSNAASNLVWQPLAGGTPVVASVANGGLFKLGGSILAWIDGDSTTQTLKVLNPAVPNSTRTLMSSTSVATYLLDNAGGQVAYTDGKKLYTWAAASSTVSLRLDAPVGLSKAFIRGGALIAVVGSAVYRIPLP